MAEQGTGAELCLQPKDGISSINPYVPGEAKAPGAGRLIRLAANEGALGPSEKAVAACRAVAGEIHRYPDGHGPQLRAALGKLHGIDPARIVFGAGSDEVLTLLMRAYAGPGDEVLYTRHGFLMYPICAKGVGAVPCVVPETPHGVAVDDILAAITPKTRAIFLANPNNPTGSVLNRDELVRLARSVPGNVLLVLDAAYAEYIEDGDVEGGYSAGFDLVEAHPNVAVTRTFSKLYAMGGLRLGWCYAAPGVVDILNRLRDPFSVNVMAFAAGLTAVEDLDFVERSVAHNRTWRGWLSSALVDMGINVFPSVTNFLLADFAATGMDAEKVRLALRVQGILVRQMGSYGLPSCLRISVGLEDEMHALVAALKTILESA